jgi:hypothetical protein
LFIGQAARLERHTLGSKPCHRRSRCQLELRSPAAACRRVGQAA